jgi:hypothetical protein
MRTRRMLPMFLAFTAAACVAGVLFSLLIGVIGATDDTSSSWSDPEPRRMLWRAVAFGIGAVLSSIAALVIHRRNRRSVMNVFFRAIALLCVAFGAFLVFGVVEALGSLEGARPGGAVAGVVVAALLGFAAVKLWRVADERSDRSRV